MREEPKPTEPPRAERSFAAAAGGAQPLRDTPPAAVAGRAEDVGRRLEALHALQLLDSAAEQSFDRLTELARQLLGVPVSLISLIDAQRQFFKSQQGLAEPWAGRRETPLSHSFCQHVVAQDDPLIISNARQHPLVCDNLAIRDLNVAAYLGVPLRTPDGTVVGSFCVIDSVPRTWTERELTVLSQLAEPTMMEMAARWHLVQRRKVEQELRQAQAELEQRVWERTAELHQSEQRYRDLVEGSVQGILIQRDGKLLFANQAFADMYGYASPDDILQLDSFFDLVVPHQHTAVRQRINLRERGEPHERYLQAQGVRRDGSLFWIEYTVTMVPWEGGPAHMATTMDITVRKQAEARLQASEDRFRDLVEGSVQGILIHQDNQPVFVNQAFAEIHGYVTPDDIYALSSLLDLIAPQDRERLLQYRDDRIAGEDVPAHYEFQGMTREGEFIWLDAVARRIEWEGAPAVQLTVIDKTSTKTAEESLQREDRLAILGRMAATFSHEVRNPLQSLRLYAEILEEEVEEQISDAQSEARQNIGYALSVIRDEATRMSDIVQDYLSLARLGTMTREPHEIGMLVSEIVRDQRAVIERQGITLELKGLNDLGAAWVHASTFRRAILNLLQNAMEAMGRGGCLTLSGRQQEGSLELEIRDTGPGIEPEVVTEIFTPFHTTKAEGTGLGLYVVQEIIAAHEGRIEVESTLGVGTIFTLNLPRLLVGEDS